MGKKRPRPAKPLHQPKSATDTSTLAVVVNSNGTTSGAVVKDADVKSKLSVDGLKDAADRLTRAASKPEDFFQPNPDVAQELSQVMRDLFAFARRSEVQRKPFGPLEELLVEGLDCESIWAELELRNAPLEKYTRRTLARLLESEDISLAADIETDDEGDDGMNEEDESDDDIEDDDDSDDGDGDAEEGVRRKVENEGDGGEEEEGEEEEEGGLAVKHAEDDDRFFDADDMEKFADQGNLDEDLDDGVLDDMYGGSKAAGLVSSEDEEDEPGLPENFGGSDSDDDEDAEMKEMLQDEDETVGGGIKHSDFFGGEGLRKGTKGKTSRKSKSVRFEESGDQDEGEGDEFSDGSGQSEEDAEDEEELSGHAAHSRRMRGKIGDQERELMAEKPWALRGEVHSTDRPQNSLLEATVDVDRATRVAPLPTPERALTLVDIIKKRCLDEKWDDVTPRNIPKPPVRKELPELSQDKSKDGLGDLYEKEFMKQTMGVEEDDPQASLKTELKQLFTKLCGKLDALCNFHYTPKTVIPEMKVQADVAAIAMEEVLPSSVADAEALAPEEVYAKKRGREAEFLEAEEMDQKDRKRARSSKKAKRRKARRQVETEQKLVSKLNPGLGNKYERAKMLKDIQSANYVTTATGEESQGREFSTSAKFFTKLQETVTAGVKAAGHNHGAEDVDNAKDRKAARFRL